MVSFLVVGGAADFVQWEASIPGGGVGTPARLYVAPSGDLIAACRRRYQYMEK